MKIESDEVKEALEHVEDSIKHGYSQPAAVTLASEVKALRKKLDECQKLAAEEIEDGFHKLRAAEISLEVEKTRSLTYLQCIQLFTGNSARQTSVFATKAAA